VALSPVPKVANVTLTKYVNLGENRWRLCQVVIAANGRIKPDYVLATGRSDFDNWYAACGPSGRVMTFGARRISARATVFGTHAKAIKSLLKRG
jgi:hypothetical protein